MGQITSHEVHTVEYSDRIAAMEEEIKKVLQSSSVLHRSS